MTENLIYAAAALAFGMGYFWGKRDYCNNLAFWKRRAADWSDSQNRLADALEAKAADIERLNALVADTAEHWMALQSKHPIQWESAIDSAMAAGCAEIEALQAEVERLKDQLSVETEPSPYCPICGSCGDEGCCGSKRCMYPDTGTEALQAENAKLRASNQAAAECVAAMMEECARYRDEIYAALQETER